MQNLQPAGVVGKTKNDFSDPAVVSAGLEAFYQTAQTVLQRRKMQQEAAQYAAENKLRQGELDISAQNAETSRMQVEALRKQIDDARYQADKEDKIKWFEDYITNVHGGDMKQVLTQDPNILKGYLGILFNGDPQMAEATYQSIAARPPLPSETANLLRLLRSTGKMTAETSADFGPESFTVGALSSPLMPAIEAASQAKVGAKPNPNAVGVGSTKWKSLLGVRDQPTLTGAELLRSKLNQPIDPSKIRSAPTAPGKSLEESQAKLTEDASASQTALRSVQQKLTESGIDPNLVTRLFELSKRLTDPLDLSMKEAKLGYKEASALMAPLRQYTFRIAPEARESVGKLLETYKTDEKQLLALAAEVTNTPLEEMDPYLRTGAAAAAGREEQHKVDLASTQILRGLGIAEAEAITNRVRVAADFASSASSVLSYLSSTAAQASKDAGDMLKLLSEHMVSIRESTVAAAQKAGADGEQRYLELANTKGTVQYDSRRMYTEALSKFTGVPMGPIEIVVDELDKRGLLGKVVSWFRGEGSKALKYTGAGVGLQWVNPAEEARLQEMDPETAKAVQALLEAFNTIPSTTR